MAIPALGTEVSLDMEVSVDAATFRIVHLDSDGSRRIVITTSVAGSEWPSNKEYLISLGLPAVIWGLHNALNARRELASGDYLPYPPADGIPIPATEIPVNQIPHIQAWERHVATMAHDVHQFNLDSGEYRLQSSWNIVPGGDNSAETLIRNQNTLQVFRAVIGDTLRRLDAWGALDPEGGDTFGTDWNQQLEGIRNIVENKLCAACEHPYSAREFARLHDYSAWRTILDYRRILDEASGSVKMRVPVIVRDTEPWQPHATDDLVFFGGTDVESGWRHAIEWFDEAVHRYDRKYANRYLEDSS